MSRSDFDPRGFFEVAEDLWRLYPHDERYLRSATSRAYYACFHLARRGLERSGRWSAGSANAHERVLIELAARNRVALRDRLRDLKRLRGWADYDLAHAFDDEATDRARRLAAHLLRQLATF